MVCSTLAWANSFFGVNRPSTVSSWLELMLLPEEEVDATVGEAGDE